MGVCMRHRKLGFHKSCMSKSVSLLNLQLSLATTPLSERNRERERKLYAYWMKGSWEWPRGKWKQQLLAWSDGGGWGEGSANPLVLEHCGTVCSIRYFCCYEIPPEDGCDVVNSHGIAGPRGLKRMMCLHVLHTFVYRCLCNLLRLCRHVTTWLWGEKWVLPNWLWVVAGGWWQSLGKWLLKTQSHRPTGRVMTPWLPHVSKKNVYSSTVWQKSL